MLNGSYQKLLEALNIRRDSRERNTDIEDSAKKKLVMNLTFTTVGGKTKNYKIEPYSYREKDIQGVRKKVLYGYDVESKSIKAFSVDRIKDTSMTDQKYKPRWNVEV